MRFITFIAALAMACACAGNTIDEPQQACAPVVKACAPVTTVPEVDACAPAYTACDPVVTPKVWTTTPYTVQTVYAMPYTVETPCKIQIQRQLRAPRIQTERTIIRERTIKTGPRYELCPPRQAPCDPMLYMVSTPEYTPCF